MEMCNIDAKMISVWTDGGLLTNNRGLQVHKQSSGNVSTKTPRVEKRVEGIFTRVRLGGTIQEKAVRADTVLQAEQLPACISSLDACLAHVDGDALSLWRGQSFISEKKRWLWFVFQVLLSLGVTTS